MRPCVWRDPRRVQWCERRSDCRAQSSTFARWRLVTKIRGVCARKDRGESQDFRVWVPRVVSLSAVALLLAAVQRSVLVVVGEMGDLYEAAGAADATACSRTGSC